MLSTLNNRWGTLFSDPFEAIRREFDRDLGFVGEGNGLHSAAQFGQLSMWEEEDHLYLELDVPGMQIDDLDLTMEKGRLWIRGERKFPQRTKQRWYDERYYGRFERVIVLNETVDPSSIEATLNDGVLHVTFSKKPEHQPQRIEVKGATDSTKRISESKSES